MSTRSTATQGTTVRLNINFKKNGELTDVYSPGTVTILNPSNVIKVSDKTPTKLSTGIYYYDYTIVSTAPMGIWTDRWTNVIYDVSLAVATVNLSFYVHESDWAPIPPNICRVYDYLYNMDGTALVGVTGTAEIISLPYDYQDTYYSNDSGGTAISDSSGRIYWDIIYGATVVFEIDSAGLSKQVIIPSVASKQLSDITEVK